MRVCWGVSGQGMAARCIIEAHEAGIINSSIVAIVADRETSITSFCEVRSMPFFQCSDQNFNQTFERAQRQLNCNYLGLTFNRLIQQSTIDSYKGNVFNLHMSLLPAFPGFGATRKAIQSGEKYAGCTVHVVTAEMDAGPIIAQAKCEIDQADTVQTLGRKQFEIALPLLLQTMRNLSEMQLRSFVNVDPDLVEFSNRFARKLP